MQKGALCLGVFYKLHQKRVGVIVDLHLLYLEVLCHCDDTHPEGFDGLAGGRYVTVVTGPPPPVSPGEGHLGGP